jgi:hypothetical protein
VSSSLRKLLICPYFGDLPEWFPLWYSNIERLRDDGYELLFETIEDTFAERVHDVLGVKYPRGDGYKVCDYRCAFGELYADELDGYDYWGHTDLDCVYGRVGYFLPDDVLGKYDIFSNHATYVSGPWSLYRNTPKINQLFHLVQDWRGYLENPATTGWVETAYSEVVDASHEVGLLRREYVSWQTRDLNDFSTVHYDKDGRLLEGRGEIMVAHFRRTKVYPPQLR